MVDVSNGGLTIPMDVEDEPMQGENPNPDEMKLDILGSNRGGEYKGEIGIDDERFRIST